MMRWSLWMVLGSLAGLIVPARAADLSASYDGTFNVPKINETAAVVGTLSEEGGTVQGTLAAEFTDGAFAGIYTVRGRHKGRAVILTGANPSGVRIKWAGKVKGATSLSGRGTLRLRGGSARGTLTLSRRSVDPPGQPRESCDNTFFTDEVMTRVLNQVCVNCHSDHGAAKNTTFRVTPNDPLATQESVALHIDVNDPESSRLVQKPLNLQPHAGGQQLTNNSAEIDILKQWATLVAQNRQCEDGGGTPDRPLVAIKPTELLVRASMDVRGIRPSEQELDAIEGNAATYDTLVDQYLHSNEFLTRVKDAYDDAFLVRREDFSDESRTETDAIFGEAIELIAYFVRNDLPMTMMGTADFTVANELFQRDTDRMPYPMEPVVGMEWQPTHYTDGRPHAGVLTTSAFYDVWDTNNTNKNRRRANRWSIVFHCYNFLDTPVDVTRDVDNNNGAAVLNAVTTRPDCKACHDRLDPLASFLFRMDNAGLEDNGATDFFRGDPEAWRRQNKRPPAVYGMPGIDVKDMGRLMVQHPKFAECQTKRAFKMLFTRNPTTSAELSSAAAIAEAWKTQDGYNFRSLMKRWMASDVYRMRPESDGAANVRRTSPELLESVYKDLTGFVWTRQADNDQGDGDMNSDPPRTEPVPLLTTEERGFKVILGGINGTSVSARSYSLNASVAMVQRKVAALAADFVVRSDLAAADLDRKLLHGVTGTEDPSIDEAAVRAAITRIARRLYGERYAPDSQQVDVWFRLFEALYADRTMAGTGQNQVPGTQSERAWRGLLVAMLRSPRLLLY